MKNEVSALMDGELDKHAAEDVFAELKNRDDLRDDWERYHLIGDTLRQSRKLSTNITQRVSMKLATEPTMLIPLTSSKYSNQRIFAFSIAASVIAMVTAWFGLQSLYQPQPTMIAEHMNTEKNMPVAPLMVSTPPQTQNYPFAPAEINDYLFVHSEFSPGTATRGLTTYIHPINDSQERYGR